MSHTLNIVAALVTIPLLALSPRFEPVPAAHAGGGGAPHVLRADQLPKKQFDQQLRQLPDSAVIESQGKRFTVGEIRARAAQRRREMAAKAQASAAQAKARLEAGRAEFLQQQQAKLQADNAKTMAEFGRLRQVAAIEQEAAQLFQRSQRAAPGERAQIEQRAGQLLQQLQQMGR